MSLNKLIEKSREFNYSDEDIAKAEKDRQLFTSKFPIEKLQYLTIDEFVEGTDDNSFCYWLEFKDIGFGIGGGNASKFGIYKTNKDQKKVYVIGSGKKKAFLDSNDAVKFFNSLLNKILKALEFTRENEFHKIPELNIPMWNMVLQKILQIYYPNKFLGIGSAEVLIECAKDIKINNIDLVTENSIQINHEIRNKLGNINEFAGWHIDKLGRFIWETYEKESKRDYYIVGSKYGENSDIDMFPQMFHKSAISTGFASRLNLREYYRKNHSKIVEYLKEQGEEKKSYNALKLFLNLKPGDRIAIKADGSPKGSKGFLSIIGIAEVAEKDGSVYRYDPGGLGHLINVKFIVAPVRNEFTIGGYGRTIHKLSNSEHIELIFKSDYQKVSIDELINIPKEARVIYSFLKKSLSHRTIQSEVLGEEAPARGGGFLAMEILHNYEINGDKKGILSRTSFQEEFESANGKYLEALELLRKYYPEFRKITSKIEKMNFPLNTILYGPPGTGKTYNTVIRAAEIVENRKINSYDEALKIFKANLHDQIEFITFHQNYSYEDFIQGLRPDTENEKDLVFERKDGIFKIIADRAHSNLLESKAQKSAKDDFEETYKDIFSDLIDGTIGEYEVKMKKTSFYITNITEKSIEFRKQNGDSKHTLSLKTLSKMYYRGQNDIIYGGLQPYYNPLLDLLLRRGNKNNIKVEMKNYVIIIDEINRANISRVFGELITLIEPDKRSHGDIPMEARLPSGDPFVVPSNLYLIGTMNTADKSIALLDIALRRRFDFESMYPLYEIEDGEIYDVEVLRNINEQIIKSKGYDFQIGHAYFMGENINLVARMNKKVIPLLLEYYMNDETEVKTILQKAGLKIEENSWPLRITGKND